MRRILVRKGRGGEAFCVHDRGTLRRGQDVRSVKIGEAHVLGQTQDRTCLLPVVGCAAGSFAGSGGRWVATVVLAGGEGVHPAVAGAFAEDVNARGGQVKLRVMAGDGFEQTVP